MGRRHPFVLLMRGAEYCAYKLCDRVISILPDTYAHMRQFQVQATHFTHVPNGIYMPDWEKQSTVSDEFSNFLQQVAGPDVFTVGYAGAYGDASDLDMLLEAAFILKDHDDINFVFVGQGTQKPAMDEFVKEHGLKNMHICNAIPKAQIPDFLSRMDTLYIGLKDKPLMQYGASPNKVFDYMMAGKPLLYGINSSNDFTALAQCGYKVDGGNPHNIADGILKLAGLDAAQRCEMGENGRHYVLAHHRYEVLADNFLKALES
jgi:glycosyltransferase involved in cell wall biosynthesis